MRTLINLNGWWGFFFRRNSRILASIAIVLIALHLLPTHPMARQMPILPLMIHRLPPITLAAVFSTAQTPLFRLIISKPLAPCDGSMIFRHLTLFIKACLHQHDVYRYADPFADVIVNVAYAGDGFPWHFDKNNFTITLAIQSADEGGLFEYAPNTRQDGENFKAGNRGS